MATIKEIAKACNVSIATVSNILNNKGKVGEETRKLVLEQVERMNYVPNTVARNLKCKTTKMIGILTEDLTVFNTPEIVDGIHECLEQRGYNFMLGNLRIYKKYGNDFGYHQEFKNHLDDELAIMRGKQVEGLIYVSAHSRDLSGMLEQDPAMPLVVVYGFAGEREIPSVIFDDEKAAAAVVTKLLESGEDQIGVIAGEKDSTHTRERLLGYQKAIFRKGVLYNPELVHYGDWSRQFGYEAAGRLFERGVRTVFSMNDRMAAGIYDYAVEHNLAVGRDVFVGGIGSEISDILRPKLTTVEMPLFAMGYCAGERIVNILEGKEKCTRCIHKIEGRLLNMENGSAYDAALI